MNIGHRDYVLQSAIRHIQLPLRSSVLSCSIGLRFSRSAGHGSFVKTDVSRVHGIVTRY